MSKMLLVTLLVLVQSFPHNVAAVIEVIEPENLKTDDPKAHEKFKRECENNNGNPAFIDQYTLQM